MPADVLNLPFETASMPYAPYWRQSTHPSSWCGSTDRSRQHVSFPGGKVRHQQMPGYSHQSLL